MPTKAAFIERRDMVSFSFRNGYKNALSFGLCLVWPLGFNGVHRWRFTVDCRLFRLSMFRSFCLASLPEPPYDPNQQIPIHTAASPAPGIFRS